MKQTEKFTVHGSRFTGRTVNCKLQTVNPFRSRKAQIQMFENVGVLVVFFFLLIAGVIFYYNYQEKTINAQLAEISQANAFRLAEIVFNMPELSCSYNNARFYSCIDKQKIQAFKNYASKNLPEYFPLLGFSQIKIGNEVVYDFPSENHQTLTYQLPIVIYDPTKQNKYCGDILRGECLPSTLEVNYYG